MSQSQRVLVADSSKYFDSSIWRMLIPEPEFTIIGLAKTIKETIKMAANLSPDIILADLSHSELRSLQTIIALHASHPDIPIIVFSLVSSQEYTQAVLKAGASACLAKSDIAEMLPQTLYSLVPPQTISTSALSYGQG